jgi:hypothetical protein
MFDEAPLQDIFMVEDVVIDFDFIDQFVFSTPNDIEWIRMAEDISNPEIRDELIVRFTDNCESIYSKISA